MQRGGARSGSGRKPHLEKSLARAEKLAKKLQNFTRLGLDDIAEHIPTLFKRELEAALKGDEKARHFLLEMVLKLVEVDERPVKPMDAARNQFQINIGVAQNVGDDSPRTFEASEYTVIPRTEGAPIQPIPD